MATSCRERLKIIIPSRHLLCYITQITAIMIPRSPRREKATICFEELCGLISHTDHPKWGGLWFMMFSTLKFVWIYIKHDSHLWIYIYLCFARNANSYRLFMLLHVIQSNAKSLQCQTWPCQNIQESQSKTDMGPVWGFSSIAFKERRNVEVVLGGLCIFLPPNI